MEKVSRPEEEENGEIKKKKHFLRDVKSKNLGKIALKRKFCIHRKCKFS